MSGFGKFRSSLTQSGIAILYEEEVRGYLDKHADMLGPVEDLCRAARQEFGPDAALSLALYHDPEIQDRHLVLYVRLTAYPSDTLRRIHAISDAHEARLCDASGSILLTTDFQRAR